MRSLYFFKRNATVLILAVLLLTTSLLALLLPDYSFLVITIPWSVLGDAALPLLLFMFALRFRSRILAELSIFSAFANLLFRLTAVVLYKEAFMPLSFQSVILLLDHISHTGLRALLGKLYLLWLIPLLLAFAVLWGYCSAVVWKVCQKKHSRLSKKIHTLVVVFTVISLSTNISYYLFSRLSLPSLYHGHLVRPIPFALTEFMHHWYKGTKTQKPIGFHPAALSEESKEVLLLSGMLPESVSGILPNKHLSPQPEFDRIIIIAAESLDADYISALNPEMPANITPNLDKLIKFYPAMRQYYASAQPTSWGLTSLFLSRFDYMRDKHGNNPSLFSEAGRKGYKTIYFSPITGLFGDNRQTYNTMFHPETVYFLEDWIKNFGLEQKQFWGLSDAELFSGVYKYLQKNRPEKFIAVISTIDMHPPYTVTGTEKMQKKYKSKFLNALHCFDFNIGNFINTLMADKELYNDRTLIIVTADHSATFGENYLKRQTFSPSRIPLIFITPKADIFKEIDPDLPASSVDLAPTILNLIAIPSPQTFIGRDLRNNKGVALSRTMDDELIVRSAYEKFTVDLKKERPDAMPQQAYYDFFKLFYIL